MLFPRFRLRFVSNLLFHVGFHTHFMMINRVCYLQKWENKPSCWKRKWNWIAVLPTLNSFIIQWVLLCICKITFCIWDVKWIGNTAWKASTHVPKSTDYNNKSYCLQAKGETFFPYSSRFPLGPFWKGFEKRLYDVRWLRQLHWCSKVKQLKTYLPDFRRDLN